MQRLFNYSSIALIFCLFIALVYGFVIKGQRDQMKEQLNSSEQKIEQLMASNQSLNQAIKALELQQQQNKEYMAELEQKRLATQQEANQQVQQFKKKQHENSTINSWANQPIPSGLY